jgi:DNA-nicking Smr family endonuclease
LKSFKSALKGFTPPSAVPEPTPDKPDPEISFRQLFADVTPLRDQRRVLFPPAKPSPRPRHLGREREALRPEHAVGWFEPENDCATFLRSGMQTATLKRLRTGHWAVCAQLDLHGLDRFQAQDQLAVFIHRARALGVCVRVIHGKGIGSRAEPVLKRMTRTWLSHHPDVLAFCEVSGGGALLILLRRHPD